MIVKWNDRLRQARDNAQISNIEISRHCKVAAASVTGWMNGDTVNIEAQNLLAVCALLNVSPFWVMGTDDPEMVTPPPLPLLDDVALLISLYGRLDAEQREQIMTLTKHLVGRAVVDSLRTASY